MKISIPLTRDSANSHPEEFLEITECDKSVTLKLTSPDREVNVAKEELRRALNAILG